MKIRTEVLIVGGGPAGATVAAQLASSGIEVCLLEKNLEHQKPCGGGMPDVVFKEFDIPMPQQYRTIRSIKIISPSGRRLTIELEGGALIIVDRQSFDKMLRQKAQNAGTLILEGTFIDILKRDKTIIVEAFIDKQKTMIESKYLVAADGVNSSVRRAMKLKPVPAAYTVSMKAPQPDVSQCEFWFSQDHAPNFYSWIFPSPGGVSIGTGTLEPKKAKLYFSKFLDRTGISLDPLLVRGYKIPLWGEDIYYVDGVFFVGDAAAQVMPFTYEGIYYSMKSAEFVAEAIIKNKPSLYKRFWKQRFYSRFKLMSRISRYFYKSNERIEILFDIFQNPKVQKNSIKLWLKKDSSKGALLSYISIFRKFLS